MLNRLSPTSTPPLMPVEPGKPVWTIASGGVPKPTAAQIAVSRQMPAFVILDPMPAKLMTKCA